MAGRTIVRAALVAGFALLAAQSAAHLIATLGFHAYDSPVDLDRNNGIPDVISIVLILSAAVGAGVLSARVEDARWLAAALVAVLGLIALADSLQEDDLAGAFGLVVSATLVAAGLLVIGVAWKAPRSARIILLLGLVLLAVDVRTPFAYDRLMNIVGFPALSRGDVLYELGIVLDEGIELMAWTLLATGLWATALTLPKRSQRVGGELRSTQSALP